MGKKLAPIRNFETAPLMGNLCPERVKFTQSTKNPGRYDATFMGVSLGEYERSDTEWRKSK